MKLLTPSRLAIVAVTAATIAPAAPDGAAAAGFPEARLAGTFAMHGRVVSAKGLPGEKPGKKFTRTWRFTSSCASGPCATVKLRRSLAPRGHTDLVLHRQANGDYVGTGGLPMPLVCNKRLEPKGGFAPDTVRVHVTGAITIGDESFASKITASFRVPRVINRTKCPGPLKISETASYAGSHRGAFPSPPVASFTADPGLNGSVGNGTNTIQFEDTSTAGGAGGTITRWSWDFGDPGSGANDTSRAESPTHTYTGPGTYTVTETVTDANGLHSSSSQQVTIDP